VGQRRGRRHCGGYSDAARVRNTRIVLFLLSHFFGERRGRYCWTSLLTQVLDGAGRGTPKSRSKHAGLMWQPKIEQYCLLSTVRSRTSTISCLDECGRCVCGSRDRWNCDGCAGSVRPLSRPIPVSRVLGSSVVDCRSGRRRELRVFHRATFRGTAGGMLDRGPARKFVLVAVSVAVAGAVLTWECGRGAECH